MKKEITQEIVSICESERLSIIASHRKNGVIIPLDDAIVIGKNVEIAAGTVIFSGCVLTGETKIGKDCHIGPNTWLFNMTVGNETSLNNVFGYDSTVHDGCDIGPFVQIRPGSDIGDKVHLGNFVEVKNSTIKEDTKVSHLTYVGDSDVGKNVNFGCGCVTVNFTGKKKFRTVIGDNAFIGCNTNLVAPVRVGDFAYTAAGSTITQDVPDNSLGIGRARQVNKVNWVLKKKPYRNMD